MKKTMSIISALALVVAMFCTMNITAFAMPEEKTPYNKDFGITFDRFTLKDGTEIYGGEIDFTVSTEDVVIEDLGFIEVNEDGTIDEDSPWVDTLEEGKTYAPSFLLSFSSEEVYDTYGGFEMYTETQEYGNYTGKVTVNGVQFYTDVWDLDPKSVDTETGSYLMPIYPYSPEIEKEEGWSATPCYTVTVGAEPEIIEGADQTVKAGAEASFRSDAPFSTFEKVLLDGAELDAANYTATEGSTIITLNADYVKTLAAGKHTIDIVSTVGTASTEFTIEAQQEEKKDDETTKKDDSTKSPATGATMGVAALTAGLGLWVVSRKRR